MRRQTRRLIFYILLGVFLLVAPIIIGYSFGYTLNLTKRTVQRTGGIFLKSKTPRLSIFLNGVFAKETSLFSGGSLLTELTPGTYLLRLETNGYQPWSKTVAVDAAQVTELRFILLLPKPVSSATSTREELPFPLPSFERPFVLDKKGNLTDLTKKILASHVHSFSVIHNAILFVDMNGFLARLNPSSGDITTIGRPGFYLDKNQIRFTPSPRGDVVLLDGSGGLFLLEQNDTLTAVEGGVTYVQFDEEGDKLLVVKENEIKVIWLTENPYQPFQTKGSKEIILRSGNAIFGAQWFFGDNAHIIIRTADGIYFTELDGRGGRNTVELVSGKTDELLTSPDAPHTIFYRRGTVWYNIEL